MSTCEPSRATTFTLAVGFVRERAVMSSLAVNIWGLGKAGALCRVVIARGELSYPDTTCPRCGSRSGRVDDAGQVRTVLLEGRNENNAKCFGLSRILWWGGV